MTLYKRHPETKKIIEGDWVNDEIKYLKDNLWVYTEKVDGTNIRVAFDGKDVVYGGRSDDAQIPTTLMYALDGLFKTFEQRKKLEAVFGTDETDVTLYGEGYGNKIQAVGKDYIADGVSFVLFDVKVGDFYLERQNVEDVADKLGIKVVPILGQGSLQNAVEIVRKGFPSTWGDFTAEGIVARPAVEMFSRKGDRMIVKVKHRDFK